MGARDVEPISPLHRSIVVPWTAERAFRRFTTEIAQWWPFRSHSVGGENAATVEFEPRVGGRLVERLVDGTECEWGRILDWDPPRRVRFTWHPGQPAEMEQEVEITFRAEGEGTRLDLVHSHWERLGDLARTARRGYPLGWAYMLSLYAGRRGPLVIVLGAIGGLMRQVARLKHRGGAPREGAKAAPEARDLRSDG